MDVDAGHGAALGRARKTTSRENTLSQRLRSFLSLSPGDNDECICKPLARASFARVGEAASGDASRGDRHR